MTHPATQGVSQLQRTLSQQAMELGFDAVHFARPDAMTDAPARLRTFLEKGYHGDMSWLQRHEKRRQSPLNLWPEVKSIVMLGMNYGPENNPMEKLSQKNNGNISVYACGADYHDLIKKRLKRLGRWLLEQETARGQQIKVFVDTAPVMEKPLAAVSGMGWQGKHTNLVSRKFGSWLFIGSIFTTIDFTPTPSEQDHCGSCTACMNACPTDAFPAPYQLDARKCISYLTIEAQEQIPLKFREKMGNRIYGCDDCLAVCPWNKFAKRTNESKLLARKQMIAPELTKLVRLDDTRFRELFSGSPVKRAGRDRFVRNVLVAMGNAGEPTYIPFIEERLADEAPLVRAMAVWALGCYLVPKVMKARVRGALMTEKNQMVRAEWERVLDA